RLDVGGTIPVLDEEPLVELQPVGGAYYRKIEPIGVEVLYRLADSLLVVGRGNDLQVFLQPQALAMDIAHGALHHQLKIVEAAFAASGNSDLALPAGTISGKQRANRGIALLVATHRRKRRGNV